MIKGIYRQCWSIRLMSRLGTGVCKFLTVTLNFEIPARAGRCRETHLFPHPGWPDASAISVQQCLGSAPQQMFSRDCGGHQEVATAKG